MKHLIITISILIILFKTGNVLSETDIFNVNNVEVNKEISKNKEKLIDQAFLKAYDKLINRLLLDKDYKKVSEISLKEIKKLIRYYQIIRPNKNENNNFKVNISFDKERVHEFFYLNNILYSDITDTEVLIFPLLKKETNYYAYTKNYFYENWSKKDFQNLIQYNLPVENIESLQKITLNENNIYKIDISDFFKEYEKENVIFAIIEIKKNSTEVFLNTRIEGKKIKKTLSVLKDKQKDEEMNNKIVIEKTNEIIADLIKMQNLIDVRTPSFLNVEIKLSNKSSLVEFDKRLKNIDLIDTYYVQQLNKDFVLIKIKYLGKIKKIIDKLKEQNINLKMTNGQWQIIIT
tara:strand:- start:6390 stop:7430 length:1041 start_codon:yes stop_codon:yes gene_type:complete